METSDSHQFTRLDQLDLQEISNQATYKPKLYGLGSGQGNLKPAPVEYSVPEILKIPLDEMRKDSHAIADKVFSSIRIPSSPKKINIHHVIFEIAEFGESNIEDIILLFLTELNMIFDNVTAKTLEKVAKKESDITWNCAPSFINDILSKLSVLSYEMVKVIIIPTKVDIALNSMRKFPQRMRRLNTEIIISDYVGDNVYLIQKPLLAEYRGSFPEIYRDGYDERLHEYWLHFSMFNSDFKPQIPEAIVRYEVKDIVVENI